MACNCTAAHGESAWPSTSALSKDSSASRLRTSAQLTAAGLATWLKQHHVLPKRSITRSPWLLSNKATGFPRSQTSARGLLALQRSRLINAARMHGSCHAGARLRALALSTSCPRSPRPISGRLRSLAALQGRECQLAAPPSRAAWPVGSAAPPAVTRCSRHGEQLGCSSWALARSIGHSVTPQKQGTKAADVDAAR